MSDGFQSGWKRRARRLTAVGPFARSIAALAPSMVVALGVAACSSTNSNPAQSPEAQSLAEYDLAKESYRLGKMRDVLSHAQKAVDLDEANADAAFLAARVYLEFCIRDAGSSDCRYEEAEKFTRKTIEANPEQREAKNMLGVILVHEKRFEEAVSVLRPLANDILYNSPESAWGNLGWAYLKLGNFDEAIDALRRSLAAQPLFCVGAYRLGLAYEGKNDFKAAHDAFTKAVETAAPECQRLQDAFDARARVGAKVGPPDLVREDLTKCVSIDKSTAIGKDCAERLAKMK